MKKTVRGLIIILGALFFFSACGTNKSTVQNKTYPKENKEDIQRDKIVNYAKKQIGVKYKYAGSSPRTGFDCSGFTQFVYSHFGYKVPRSSSAYAKVGKKISIKNAQKGDILLFTGSNKRKRITGHVGIVVSNKKGTLKFIHASSSRGVMISNTDVKYFKERILGARTIF